MKNDIVSPIAETGQYDNCLDIGSRSDDAYKSTLDSFFDSAIEIPIVHSLPKKSKASDSYVRMIYVHFRNAEDHLDFCNKIGQVIPFEMNSTYYPLNPDNAILGEDKFSDIDISAILPKKLKYKPKNKAAELDFSSEVADVVDREWKLHWHGMPEFVQEKAEPYKSVYVKIRTEDDLKSFGDISGYNITEKTKFMWYPKTERPNNLVRRWIGPVSIPKYPMYIVSKGRHESMMTSKAFVRMKVPHYIIIEPQDYDNYVKAIQNFNLDPYVTLIVAPFSNHGDGPGRARNYAWDHSISIGAKKHWVFDDNIDHFYRLHKNTRYRVMTGAMFNAMEDFVDRFDNIMIAGPQYYFFCANTQVYPPYVLNTRIYSSLLIDNSCKHRWRGRYNEDTDLSLRVLKDGDVTLQFNIFLQGKMGTQIVKGGNTAEFYHAEGNTNKEEWRGGIMNATGTINKSKMLVDMHPDVASLVWKYGRWHHYVDYGPFRNNKLRYKENYVMPTGINNYGITFTDTYDITSTDRMLGDNDD